MSHSNSDTGKVDSGSSHDESEIDFGAHSDVATISPEVFEAIQDPGSLAKALADSDDSGEVKSVPTSLAELLHRYPEQIQAEFLDLPGHEALPLEDVRRMLDEIVRQQP